MNWNLLRISFGILTKSEDSGDHDVNNVLYLPVCVLTIANIYFWSAFFFLKWYFEITGKNIWCLEPLGEYEDVHPSKQKEEHEESSEHFSYQFKPFPLENDVRSVHHYCN